MSRNFFKALKKLCPNFGWFPCIKCWLWPLVHLLTGWQSFHRRNNSFQEHNTLFSAHMQPCSVYTKYGPCRIPPTLMIRRLNYLLSTHCTLNKFCPLMIFCNGFSQNGAPWFAAYFVLKIYPTSCENGVSEHAVARFGQFDVFFVFFFTKWGTFLSNKNNFSNYSHIPIAVLMQGLQLIFIHLPTQKNLFCTHAHSVQILRKNFNLYYCFFS